MVVLYLIAVVLLDSGYTPELWSSIFFLGYNLVFFPKVQDSFLLTEKLSLMLLQR